MTRSSLTLWLAAYWAILGSCTEGSSTEGSSTDSKDQEVDTVDAGGHAVDNGSNSPCPAGMECTAPAGEFVCTDPNLGTPPVCTQQDQCTFGVCTPFEGKSYCVESCAPAPIKKCPEGSFCGSLLGGAYTCMGAEGAPPTCTSQQDCNNYGDCLPSIGGIKLCLQPCDSTQIETECPFDTACTPLAGRFYCAQTSTGVPDTCDPQADSCQYGTCLTIENDSYCVLECQPQMVSECPSPSMCLLIWQALVCADPNTFVPPSCQTQSDCSYGTCIRYEDESYCTEYCSTPTTFAIISGVVTDLNGPQENVSICLKEDSSICTESLKDGTFSLVFAVEDLTEQEHYLITLSKQGYLPNLQIGTTGQINYGLLYTETEMKMAAEIVGISFPQADTGSILFSAYKTTSQTEVSMVENFSVSIVPTSGSGPYYLSNDLVTLNPSLSASSIAGSGILFNTDPGDYTVTFSHPSLTCENMPKIPVVSGYLSWAATSCQ